LYAILAYQHEQQQPSVPAGLFGVAIIPIQLIVFS
jgi:hypothetical protein